MTPAERTRRSPTSAVSTTAVAIAAVVLAYAVLAWHRRWIADDGLIVVRTAREIVAGNGPVYSPYERVEASTSALWTWLLAGAGWITGGNLVQVAMALGGLLAVGGLALALDATRRLHRAGGHPGALIPAGALVVLAVFPFWDFATSGLEIGLAIGWLGAIWWLLVTLRSGSAPRWQIGVAIAFGLGPLVRPELAIASAVFLAAGTAIARPRPLRALGLAGCAAAIPVAYEVFRAGYYGSLVPLPALAKSASAAEWARGLAYLMRFVRLELLYVPIAALTAVVIAHRRELVAPHRVVFAAPIVTAVLLAGFLVRVGGDFMFGRLLLPATLLGVAPVLVVPLRRTTAVAAIALAIWGLAIAIWYAAGVRHLYDDERMLSARWTGQPHPTDDDYQRMQPTMVAGVDQALRLGRRVVVFDNSEPLAMAAARDAPMAIVSGFLGLGGSFAPLDGIVVDELGLANPIGARITRTQPGRVGHEKRLPRAWVHADVVDPSAIPAAERAAADAARHAMTCGELAELVASVRAPMTASRFWDNLTGSLRRTLLVIPAAPADAERRFCR